MDKRRVFKYIGLVLASLILFPIAPLIVGSFIIYKIAKSASSKKAKLFLAGLTVVIAFILTGKIVSALPAPSPTPKPEVKSEKIEVSLQPTSESTTNPLPNPNITYAKVINVVDGDTFTLESGQVVRMIGMDTPETVHPSKPVQCYGKEASLKTEELLQGKEINLEKDVSETDRYNRLLRYVYVGDLFVNEYLVSEGYAKSSSYPPDIKYQDKFIEAQKKAQEENKGLWNISACPTITPTPKPVSTVKPITPKPATNTTNNTTTVTQPSNNTGGGSYTCNCSKTCPNMSCSEAQYQLNVCGCSARDADKDGTACDSQCQ